jgi:hypothetical protein
MFRTTHDTISSTVSGNAADIVQLMNAEHIPEHNRGQWESNRNNINGSYDDYGGIKSAQQAVEVFTITGWTDGADRAKKALKDMRIDKMVPAATTQRRKPSKSAEGDSLCIDNALAGNWDRAYNTRTRRTARGPKVISIGCGFGGAGATTHNEFWWCGLQMAAICETLELAGYRVELRALKMNNFGSTKHAQDWTVKQSDQPLRLDTILALFGHAGVYRTFGWAGNTATQHKAPGNGGRVIIGEEMREEFQSLAAAKRIPQLDIIIPQAYSEETMKKQIAQTIKSVTEAKQ